MSSEFISRSGHPVLHKDECRSLLKEFREAGVATVDRSYSRGSLYHREEAGCEFCILTEGVIKLLSNYSRNRYFAHLLGPWSTFGPLVSAGEPIRWVCAEAFADCEIVKVSRSSLEQAIRSRPEIALKLIAIQELRLIQYQELVERLLSRRTEVRLANLLSTLAWEFGERHYHGRLSIELPLTHLVLAEMVAATRESVVATVKGLCKRKVIQVERERIVILDPEKLAEIRRR